MYYRYLAKSLISRLKESCFYCMSLVFLLSTLFLLFNLLVGYSTLEKENILRFPTIVSLELDMKKISDSFGNSEATSFSDIKPPSFNELKTLGLFPEIKEAALSLSDSIYTPDLRNIDYIGRPIVGVFTFKGVEDGQFLDNDLGLIHLERGDRLKSEQLKNSQHPAIISTEVAEKNGLRIGDNVNLRAVIGDPDNDNLQFPFILKITGTYNLKASQEISELLKIDEHLEQTAVDGERTDEPENHAHHEEHNQMEEITEQKMAIAKNQINTIYLLNDSVRAFGENYAAYSGMDYSENPYQATYWLHSEKDTQTFQKKAAKLLSEYFYIRSPRDEYREMTAHTVQSLSYVRLMILLLVVILLLVQLLFTLYFFRSRADLVTLFSINGCSGKTIVKQLRVEQAMLIIPSAFMSFFIGHFFSRRIGELNLTDSLFSWGEHSNTLLSSNLAALSKDLVDTSLHLEDYLGINWKYVLLCIMIIILLTFLSFITLKSKVSLNEKRSLPDL